MHKKTRVLIVEKEKNVSAAFKLMLKDIFEAMQKGNFEINTTQDYDKAKRKLKNKKFDLLLYDVPYEPFGKVQLNKKVLEDLKLIHIKHPRLPVIATSTMQKMLNPTI